MSFLPGMANYKDFPMTAAERANRSVFVGNIPYEATEEQLKDIFAQVGPVVSFRLVYDRETGKPKGYGFCEYQDIETAKSAMRNLNNHDFNGRPLRVGVAAGEQSKDENKSMQQALGGPPVESPFGDPSEPEKAPEAISKAVASLPPEQMFELMKQMKLCIQNNPNEARNMLLQNPQLAYALLQAQIVMKIVDPQVALAMLHRQTEQIPPLVPSENTNDQPAMPDMDARDQPQPVPQVPAAGPGGPLQGPGAMAGGPPTSMGAPNRGPGPVGGGHMEGIPPASMGGPNVSMGGPMATSMGGPPVRMPAGSVGGPPHGHAQTMNTQSNMGPRPQQDFGPGGPGGMGGNRGPRGGLLGDHPPARGGPNMPGRMEGPPMGDSDLRGPRDLGGPGPGPGMRPQGHQLPPGHRPPGHQGPPGPGRGGPPQDYHGGPGRGGPDMGPMDPRGPGARPESRDPRQAEPRRNPANPGPMGGPMPRQPGPGAPGAAAGGQDQEKAALIMQVLQLTDEQIALLPPDQRQSILILKDQIARSAL